MIVAILFLLFFAFLGGVLGLTDKQSFINCKKKNTNFPLDLNLPMKYASKEQKGSNSKIFILS